MNQGVELPKQLDSFPEFARDYAMPNLPSRDIYRLSRLADTFRNSFFRYPQSSSQFPLPSTSAVPSAPILFQANTCGVNFRSAWSLNYVRPINFYWPDELGQPITGSEAGQHN